MPKSFIGLPVESGFFMSKIKTLQNQIYNKTRQAFLLTFFNLPEHNKTITVNGFILHCHINGNTREFEVAIYTSESWEKAQLYLHSASQTVAIGGKE